MGAKTRHILREMTGWAGVVFDWVHENVKCGPSEKIYRFPNGEIAGREYLGCPCKNGKECWLLKLVWWLEWDAFKNLFKA